MLSKPQMEHFVSRWCVVLCASRGYWAFPYVRTSQAYPPCLCRMDFDPNATMFIKMSQLVPFFKVLRAPMGFGFNFFISERELWDKIRAFTVCVCVWGGGVLPAAMFNSAAGVWSLLVDAEMCR